MSDRAFLVTTTGEPFQPSRLHYTVRDNGYAVRIVEQRFTIWLLIRESAYVVVGPA